MTDPTPSRWPPSRCSRRSSTARWVRLLVDHRTARAAVPREPRPQSGAGADRGRAERLRPLGQPRGVRQRLAAADADDHRPRARDHRRHGDAVARQFGLAAVLHLRRAAAADPAAGGRLPPADSQRAFGESRLRRRRRRALFGDDDLGSAARDHAEQPGVREEGLSRGARAGSARRVVHDGGGLRVRRDSSRRTASR